MPVFHRPESRFYWYQFAVDGRRYRGSTKVTNKTTAEMISGKKFLEVVDGRAPLPRKAPRLVEFSERFLSWVERSNLQDQTKLYYRAGWRLLSLTPIAPLRLTEIGDDRAASLFFPGSPSNGNCAIRTLRRMFHKAQDWNQVRAIPKFRLAREYARSLTLDQQAERRLLKVANQTLADIVVLLRDTGMRNQRELYCLRTENIDWNRKTIFIPDSKSPCGRRTVPMSNRVIEILARRCPSLHEGWVFPSPRARSGHLTTMAKTFQRAREKAGLPRQLVLYCCRHDYGTRILRQTGNLAAVMETMGHKDFQTAMKYQHPDLDIVRRALNRNAPTRASQVFSSTS
jgi:hypothetical protein